MSSAVVISSSGLPLIGDYAVLNTTRDEAEDWRVAVNMAERFVIYVTILLLFFMILALIAKLLGYWEDDDSVASETAAERSRLLAKEAVPFTYGTCEEDLEAGKCSSSSEDLYDGKICVICYDDQRDCFFVPCGHCISCYHCARRIKEEESKSCPVCRRHIGKISKLFGQ